MSRGLGDQQPPAGAVGLGVRIAAGAALLGFVAMLAVALMVVGMLEGSFASTPSCESGVPTTLPLAGGTVVAATVYSDTGAGAYGLGLEGHLPYAELGLHSVGDTVRAHANRIGLALGLKGPLAPLTPLEIRAPNGRSVVAEKRDIGMGGPPIDGHPRAIDLWTTTREKLGLGPDWSGLVQIAVGPEGHLTAETSSLSETPESPAESTGACGEGSVEASGINQRIVQIAQREVGYLETGGFCTKFGPCQEWCAYFVTWVWRQAGVKVPSIGYSGTVYTWASEHTHAYPPSAHPQPGWAVLFGSGPGASAHVGIVEKVLPDGQITVLNGDFRRFKIPGGWIHGVVRSGPCAPSQATSGCEEPAAIYGYASPT